ncbi:hypothetical protein RHMOL_Rhmol13G0107200 [Rhododendron molle]|uniref:Uncharacterized protein n=1 Tax=Rhododendron molle TaxID=49168 RepID=A0ACC0L569_RHOML|nr:hypothetical protein RHMOL_Rhmol13G0107200 [Rhododendron molle]
MKPTTRSGSSSSRKRARSTLRSSACSETVGARPRASTARSVYIYATSGGRWRRRSGLPPATSSLARLRDYQDDKADVILKYMPDEDRLLKHIVSCRRQQG